MKSFVSQLLNIPAERDNVMFFLGGGSMVQPFLLLFATPLTFRDRALDTIHEALTISGGSCFGMHHSRMSRSHSCCVQHSVQIHYGWPSEPIVNNECDTVSHCFQNFRVIFYI
jgi:hypothetical protein